MSQCVKQEGRCHLPEGRKAGSVRRENIHQISSIAPESSTDDCDVITNTKTNYSPGFMSYLCLWGRLFSGNKAIISVTKELGGSWWWILPITVVKHNKYSAFLNFLLDENVLQNKMCARHLEWLQFWWQQRSGPPLDKSPLHATHLDTPGQLTVISSLNLCKGLVR